MSNLYVRVRTGFYTHRKTAKLRSIIGDDAFWVVPRLWAYAAENQPDGDLSSYTSEELAMLIGCPKHAASMLQALLGAGFIDSNGFIHDWNEYNGYHAAYSERAKLAAKARWSKERPPTPPKERNRKQETGKGRQALLGACLEHKSRGTLEEVRGFCVEIGLPESDSEWFFHKCEANGWTNGGNPIKDWRSTIRSWKAGNYLPSQKGNNGSGNAAGNSSLGQRRSPSEERNFFAGVDAAERGRQTVAAIERRKQAQLGLAGQVAQVGAQPSAGQ